MTAEFISIGVGNTGTELSSALWAALEEEHTRAPGNWEPFYKSVDGERGEPRAICYDVKRNPSIFLTHRDTTLEDSFAALLSDELEQCDRPTTFFLLYNASGGCGSGASANIMEELASQAPKSEICSLAVVPAEHQPQNPVDLYNALLNLAETSLIADAVQLVDYDALYRIALNQMSKTAHTPELLHALAVTPAVHFTALQRFPHSGSKRVTTLGGLAKALNAAAPFFTAGAFPYQMPNAKSLNPLNTNLLKYNRQINKANPYSVTWRQLGWSIFKPEHITLSCDPIGDGKYLNSCMAFRGTPTNPLHSIEQLMSELRLIEQHSAKEKVRSWKAGLPRRIHSYLGDSEGSLQASVAFAGNSSAVGATLTRLINWAEKSLKAQAWCHQYARYTESDNQKTIQNAAERIRNVVASYDSMATLVTTKQVQKDRRVSFLWSDE